MYEALFLISPDVKEKDISLITEKIGKIIQTLNGLVSYKNNLGKKKLAYSLRHEKSGFYFVINFELEPEKIKFLEEKFKDISEILRFQIIKIKSFVSDHGRSNKIKL